MKSLAQDIRGAAVEAHNSWGWYLALGIVLILAGAYCMYAETFATLASVVAIGAVLFVAGAAQVAGAFFARGAGHVVLLLLIGLLDGIVGVMLMQHPDLGALALTLIISALLVFGGAYRFVVALALQLPNYGWAAFSAAISVVLGIMLWAQWPVSAAWFIGFAVGLELVFAGISWSTIAFKLKDLPAA